MIDYSILKKLIKTLIVILGPTASGKTNLAIDIAKHFNTEIISADSRQFYKEIPIGTATPTRDQLKIVNHHFIGQLSIQQNYNVSRFEQEVLVLLKEKFKTLDTMIMAGGSGLYIDAVCKGIDELPDPDINLRNELEDLYKNKGLSALCSKLEQLDPAYFQKVDKNNSKRLIRAIEVCIQTGKTYSELRKNKSVERDFNILKIGLDIPRALLNERINFRTDEMINNGWIEEASAVFSFRESNALNTVGYKELFKYFDGNWDLETAIEKIKTNTRRYAKRQMTWFKKDKTINWFPSDGLADIAGFIESKIEE